MSEEQQKILWMQLNKEAICTEAAKADASIKGDGLSMDEIVKITRDVRRKKKKV